MRVGIHQPEHFPYLGYFQKMIDCDYFIILDNVKFKKNNWQNRNRFLNHRGEEEWFTVPVGRKANSKKIMDVKVEDGKWRTKIIKQMSQRYPKWAKDFEYIYQPKRLIDINMRSISHCLKYFQHYDFEIHFASTLNVSGKKTELLYNLCKEVGATTYVAGQGGLDYLDTENYFKDIKLEIFKPIVSDHYTTLSHI